MSQDEPRVTNSRNPPPIPPIHAVAFDFFGTLGRWQPGTIGSPAQVLYAAAPDPDQLDTRHLVSLVEGVNGTSQFDDAASPEAYTAWEEESWTAAARYAGVPVTPGLIDELRAVITDRRLELFPDVRPALEALHAHRVPWVLCSNASPDVEGKLHALLPEALRPQACVVSCRVGARKPHPRMFTTALRQLSPLAAEQVLFIGDRVDCDVVGPREHGFRTALLDRAEHPADAAPESVDTPVWGDLHPLADLLQQQSSTLLERQSQA
ncbi:HAD family hydrolase [Streptomyces sp. NPDC050658]|uniref:HAD family hydrolase n=1 Tax=unclassified Streptomyces TaxID=2593676 RepID=UPI003429716B